MEKFYQFIILSKDYNKIYKDLNILIINEQVNLINDYTIHINNDDIGFDYLIFDDPLLINNFLTTNILHDDGLPVTNYFLQTSLENIFFTVTKRIDEVINNIIENIV